MVRLTDANEADANTNYDLETALAMTPKLACAGLQGLESPLPPNLMRGYQTLTRQGALPILMDEGIVSPVEVAEFIALKMFDGISMKVARCGGLWNASRILTLLRENKLLVFGSGLTDPDLSLAATAHLFACAGLDSPTALNGPQYIAGRGTTDPLFRADGDMIPVPTAPGAGHYRRFQRAKVAEHRGTNLGDRVAALHILIRYWARPIAPRQGYGSAEHRNG
jgi:muconate cycloisomerase